MQLDISVTILLAGLVRTVSWAICSYFLYRNRQNIGAASAALACLVSFPLSLDRAGAQLDSVWVEIAYFASTPIAAGFAITALHRTDLRSKPDGD